MRPEHPAEMPLGPGVWGYVPGNKVAVGSFLLSHCCSSRLPGCGFGVRSDLTPQLPASRAFSSQARPSEAEAPPGVAQGQRKPHQPPGSSWGLAAPTGLLQMVGPEA